MMPPHVLLLLLQHAISDWMDFNAVVGSSERMSHCTHAGLLLQDA